MAKVNEIKAQLQKKGGTKPPAKGNTLADLIKKMEPQIKRALPKHLNVERFTRIILTEVRKNPKLLDCDPMSFMAAMMTAAQLGLEPGSHLGQAYIIPYYNRKLGKTLAQFQLGYKGIIDLFYRSEQALNIDAHEVCENDEFEFEYGLHPKLYHKPSLNGRGKVIAYYAVAHLKDGGYSFMVMSVDDIEKIRKRSKTPNEGPWITDYDAMAKKTVIKQLLKYMPLSVELQRKLSTDETTKIELSEHMDEAPDETDWEIIDVEAKEIPANEKEEKKVETEESENGKVDKPKQKEILNPFVKE
ncbi:recombinase RecT [Thermosipho melanesiensis]|uniref:RecT protein n=2 Tax=Thermosipho melanesiensis TaxID=46541 RepID=A6LN18_THEM4|nr:recombination protein RecT [Thermosipho melanesiensis]ABR31319.1 RecT protein [Thermosipho melanesiensis BI429]APT74388.1 recombinase RecT [Thermosipho melanesiensis]OOC36343.1 recombinase RecT [Thermosipho melanesiensis]OOC37161.1 recombinase RecT [Thermosipho melanesiensis]OOC37913.1 recombinase RecT [Thermosipho melanesiensis]